MHTKRSQVVALAAAFALVIALIPAQRAEAALFVKIHTVWYDCVLGPYPGIVGEWVESCDGTMEGWGWEPGHSCTFTETVNGEFCGPEDPE